MKIKLLFVSAFVFVVSHSYSQNHDISVGMGIASSNQIVDAFESSISSIFFPGYSTLEETSSLGEFRLAYAFTPKERWSYGVALSYSKIEYDIKTNNAKVGEQTSSYYTFAGETTYSYINKEKIKLYALVGLGATLSSTERQTDSGTSVEDDTNDTFFNFQITPIGFRYGKKWGGFAEAGFGYRGIISFGAFYKFI